MGLVQQLLVERSSISLTQTVGTRDLAAIESFPTIPESTASVGLRAVPSRRHAAEFPSPDLTPDETKLFLEMGKQITNHRPKSPNGRRGVSFSRTYLDDLPTVPPARVRKERKQNAAYSHSHPYNPRQGESLWVQPNEQVVKRPVKPSPSFDAYNQVSVSNDKAVLWVQPNLEKLDIRWESQSIANKTPAKLELKVADNKKDPPKSDPFDLNLEDTGKEIEETETPTANPSPQIANTPTVTTPFVALDFPSTESDTQSQETQDSQLKISQAIVTTGNPEPIPAQARTPIGYGYRNGPQARPYLPNPQENRKDFVWFGGRPFPAPVSSRKRQTSGPVWPIHRQHSSPQQHFAMTSPPAGHSLFPAPGQIGASNTHQNIPQSMIVSVTDKIVSPGTANSVAGKTANPHAPAYRQATIPEMQLQQPTPAVRR